MSLLLDHIDEAFVPSNPRVRVVVLGYYSIFSEMTRFPDIGQVIQALIHETFNPPQLESREARAFKDPVSEAEGRLILNGKTFRDAANADLQAAVTRANAKTPGEHYIFVDPAFADEDAAFAPNALIWGLNREQKAEDPRALDRQHYCAQVGSTPGPDRFACDRASLGHPNIGGAQKYARAILSALAAHPI